MEPRLSSEAEHAVHFREVIQRLAQKFDPLQIFSFSQNSYTHNSQGCFKDNQGYSKCDYCLLVVTETATRIDYKMQDFANNLLSAWNDYCDLPWQAIRYRRSTAKQPLFYQRAYLWKTTL